MIDQEVALLKRQVQQLRQELAMRPLTKSISKTLPPADKNGVVLSNDEDATEWRSAVVLGTEDDGAGTLKVWTAANEYIELKATGEITLFRGGVAFAVCHVATITSVTTAPSGPGVKGQMHMIY